MKFLFLGIFFLTFLSSCQDRKNILVTGTITDELTGKPIPKAEVVVVCWYMSSWEEAGTESQAIVTDERGRYRARFAKGHKIGVAAKAVGAGPGRHFSDLEENQIEVNLKLAKINENPTLIKYLNTEYTGDELPFLRVRIAYHENSSVYSFNEIETLGFDFHTLTTTSDTANSDIWFKPVIRKESEWLQPYILIANKGGGIMPVYSHEFKSSFLYDKPVAPQQGYVQEYEFKGNEDGFFVLCRDGRTYGKIIFEKSLVSSGKDGFTDFGRYFSCLYQPNGTTNLFYSATNIDLESFLVDGRQR